MRGRASLATCGDTTVAGGKPDPNDAIGLREEYVRAVLDQNRFSTILTSQAVLLGIMTRRTGRIVTIGKGRTQESIYVAARPRATLDTRFLAIRSYNIAVNVVRSKTCRPV